ncbi:MAG: DUF4332 domain-containing protein [Anaerolineales bacterium]|nr:DUF4332 domain-containing protein [Anaerolineales bacterium]
MLALRLLSEGGEGPDTTLQWLLMVGIAFFFLMVIVGWWSSSRKQSQPEVKQEAHGHHVEKQADDLVKIEGIGPKVAKLLNGAGITTFEQLAHSNSAEIQKLLNEAGMQMMNPEGWIDQAKLAAKGDWKSFEKLQGELKGGRKK